MGLHLQIGTVKMKMTLGRNKYKIVHFKTHQAKSCQNFTAIVLWHHMGRCKPSYFCTKELHALRQVTENAIEIKVP